MVTFKNHIFNIVFSINLLEKKLKVKIFVCVYFGLLVESKLFFVNIKNHILKDHNANILKSPVLFTFVPVVAIKNFYTNIFPHIYLYIRYMYVSNILYNNYLINKK